MQQIACVMCAEKGKRTLAISVPALVVPIKNWPIPLYLRFNGAICHAHTAAFTIKTFTDKFGPQWYEMVADHLRSKRAPAINPFPDDPNFKWESFIVNPRFDPAPREECYVQFWEPETLAAKGAHQRMWDDWEA